MIANTTPAARKKERRVFYLPVFDKQEEFLRSRSIVTGFIAGRGSGKSTVGAMKIFTTARDGELWMAVSPSYPIMEDTTWPTTCKLAKELRVWVKGKKSPTPRITFRTRDGGAAEISFRSGDNPESLRGPSLAGAWLDEASLMQQAAFDCITPGLRHEGRMGALYITMTPRGRRHWTFERFYQPLAEALESEANANDLDTEDIGGRLYARRANTHLIRAHTAENPFAPPEQYEFLREQFTTAYAAQELAGEFVELAGTIFQRYWFETVDHAPRDAARVRYWDRAATLDGCESAGVRMARSPQGIFYIEDVIHGHWTAHARNEIIRQTAAADAMRFDNEVYIYAEQEGGSGGKEQSDQFIRDLAGYPVYRDIVSGKKNRVVDKLRLPGEAKVVRALPLAAQAEAGNVKIVRGVWNEYALDQLAAFPEDQFNDVVDACAGAFNKLAPYAHRDPGEVITHQPASSAENYGLRLIQSRQRRTHGE